ncbi:MAG TPA: universal stress protein [Hyphomicrobiales bacterium]|nr:universal stress protein [Hyphomicrobiales bacterium]
MAIKDLLVAYQGDEGSNTALKFALQMAKKYDATVTGAHVHVREHYASQVRTWIPEDVLERVHEAEQEAVATIEKSFRAVIAESGVDARHDWIALEGPPSLLLSRLVRSFDLLLTGQFEGAIRHGGRVVQPEELLLRSGKPMIIVPQGYNVRPFKEEAAVAWDGSRSAARALTDAMQILETKKKLHVVTVSRDGESEDTQRLGDHDIFEHLKRHGIDAQPAKLQLEGGVGRTILDYCDKIDPDVLVMGAYGRGNIGALLFGGVSRHVLEHQTVPVMMSH